MSNRSLLLFLFFLAPLTLYAQIGGDGTYQFLNLTHSARVAALGSKTIAINDDDLDVAFLNPSLLNLSTSNHASVSYVSFFDGINFGESSYGFQAFGKSAAVSLQYIDYGKFIESQDNGTITGSFTAADYVVQFSMAHQFDSLFSIGATVKPVYSVYEHYTSFGLASDLAASYTSRDRLFCASLLFRNMGTQIKTYTGSSYESLPFEIMVGVSQKLRYAPFRFSLTAHQLQKPKLTYTNPDDVKIDPLSNKEITTSKSSQFADNVFRHLIVGVEFLPLKSFVVRVGYNHQRRKELAIADAEGMSGFSWGFGLKLRKFSLSYGRSFYIPSQASNHFSLMINFMEFGKN